MAGERRVSTLTQDVVAFLSDLVDTLDYTRETEAKLSLREIHNTAADLIKRIEDAEAHNSGP